MLALGVQFDSSIVTHSVLDDAQQSFLWALPDANRLSDEPVTPNHTLWRRHGSGVATGLHSWVHLSKIWARLLSTALRCQSGDIGAPDGEDTAVFERVFGLHKQDPAMDMEDLSLSAFSTMLLDSIIVVDLRSVAVCGYGVAVLGNDSLDLRMEHVPNIAMLIQESQDFPVNLDDTSDRRCTV